MIISKYLYSKISISLAQHAFIDSVIVQLKPLCTVSILCMRLYTIYGSGKGTSFPRDIENVRKNHRVLFVYLAMLLHIIMVINYLILTMMCYAVEVTLFKNIVLA